MSAPGLTMTALDTQGLRMWIGTASTRQKAYAVLTMPDFAAAGSELMDKPDVALAAGFSRHAYAGLRTDRFSGAARRAGDRRSPAQFIRRLDPLRRSAPSYSDGPAIPRACM